MLSILQDADRSFSQQPQTAVCSKKLYFHTKTEEIPLFPDGVWQVTQGLVQLSADYEAGEVLFGWVDTGACFSYHQGNAINYRAIALSPVYLRWFRLDEIEIWMPLSQLLLPQLARRMRQAEPTDC